MSNEANSLHPLAYEADEPTCGRCGVAHNSYGNSVGTLRWDCRKCDAPNVAVATLKWTTVSEPQPEDDDFTPETY